ncbi:Nif3-like dinuclear metal center hexameric protein [Cecembia rubra]|uniref:GTP cyclohydrolase 1 type 2 homolog n=1 Tax=Cecembia rubra TaxID=1485585 RepID=A0A2P8E648_9BACT|nr:Nif3-like dinuclear metal center hexameric protein [Cecembia rubra]PSL04943.1 dinuclear metal center YbgI/SA1388 family protein [Cecembia rubra]
MVYTIQDIVSYLEKIAPPAYQESYDNAQLITGDSKNQVKGILCSLDATEAVIEEAISLGCNLVIAHHPIIFKGLKSLTGKNYVERTIIKAIKNDIAIYAIHTNLDHVAHGVNKKIADKIGLTNTSILQPKKELLSKLTTFVPLEAKEKVLSALFEAGAGQIGEYSGCSFIAEGNGTFIPSENANPTKGVRGKVHEEAEVRIEVLLPSYLEKRVLASMKNAHPYEEVAYFLHKLENENQLVGAGMIGELSFPMDEMEFLLHLKKNMNLKVIKHTSLLNRPIQKVAICGGAGIFLLKESKKSGADIFITADVKYHEFFDAENQIVVCDIGHYESEIYTKELLGELLSQNFTNIALYLTKVVTNPITYL